MRQRSMASTGTTLAILSAAGFGTSGTLASSLFDVGWTPGAAALARSGVGALVLSIPAIRQLRAVRSMLSPRLLLSAAVYGLIAVAGCQLAFFNAVQRVSVGVALLLEYLGVILVVGWLWVRHAQRPRRLTSTGSVAAVVGLILVLNLTGNQVLSPVGVAWGLLAATGLALYYVLSAGMDDALPPLAMTWIAMMVGSLAIAVLGVTGAMPLHARAVDVELAGHQVSWLVPVVGLAVLAGALAYVAGIAAARHLGAKVSSFIGFSEVLFAIAFAWLFLGQLPAPVQFAGGVLIIAGLVLVRLDEYRGASQGPVRLDEYRGALQGPVRLDEYRGASQGPSQDDVRDIHPLGAVRCPANPTSVQVLAEPPATS